MNNFGEWILAELEKRNLSQADLARMTGSSRAAISNLISGERPPGKKLAEKIASAFHIPVVRVYQEAGLLPPDKTEHDELAEEASTIFRQIESEEGRRHAIAMLRALAGTERGKRRGAEVSKSSA